MWVATVGLSLLGLLLLIVGPDAEARWAGASSIAFFGGGGGAYLYVTRPRTPPASEVGTGRTEVFGLSEAGVELAIRPGIPPVLAVGFMLALGLGLTVVGVLDGAWVLLVIGVANLVLFLYTAGAYARRRKVRQRLVLTATGLVFEHPVSTQGIRWGDIDGLSLFTQYDNLYLGVEAPPEALVLRDGSRRFNRLGRAISGSAITVPTLGLPADPERLIDALSGYADDPSPLRDPGRERAALEARLALGDQSRPTVRAHR